MWRRGFSLDERQSNPGKRKPWQDDFGGAGVPPAVFLPNGTSLKIHTRRLPHWEVENAIYFVTFRLADSLPNQALNKIDFQRKGILTTTSKMGRALTAAERKKIEHLEVRRIEKALDLAEGECFLKNPQIAQVVVDALKTFDGSRYRLFAWSVMPNHVHVLFRTIEEIPLSKILHSWKSFSAKEANRILRRSGEFWQREYYDRLIRNQNEFDRALRYVTENPEKAGLKDWPWAWSWE
jgi:REP element-mobilizing transposase RayT